MKYLQPLLEFHRQNLFHAVKLQSALFSILENDIIERGSYMATYGNEEKARVYSGVSTTRDKNFYYQDSDFKFELDWSKLLTKYQIRPYDFLRGSWGPKADAKSREGFNESEEFVLTNKGIEPLHSYLVAIHINNKWYKEMIEEYANLHRSGIALFMIARGFRDVLKAIYDYCLKFDKVLKVNNKVVDQSEVHTWIEKWHDIYENGLPDQHVNKPKANKLTTIDL